MPGDVVEADFSPAPGLRFRNAGLKPGLYKSRQNREHGQERGRFGVRRLAAAFSYHLGCYRRRFFPV